MRLLALLFSLVICASCVLPSASGPTPSASSAPASVSSSALPASGIQPTHTAIGAFEVYGLGELRAEYAIVLRGVDPARDGVSVSPRVELWAVSLAGGAPRLGARFEGAHGLIQGGNVPRNAVAPDGHRIVLAANLPSANGERMALVVADLERGTAIVITHDDTFHDVMPAWSPDGKAIAFARRERGDERSLRDAGLWLTTPEGGAPRLLVPRTDQNSTTFVYGWSAESRWVGFGHAFETVTYSVIDPVTSRTSRVGSDYLGGGSWRDRSPTFVGVMGGTYAAPTHVDVAEGAEAPTRTVARTDQGGGCGIDQDRYESIVESRWRPGSDDVSYIRHTWQCLDSGRSSKIVPESSGLRLAEASGGFERTVATVEVPAVAEWIDPEHVAYLTQPAAVGRSPVSLRIARVDGRTDRLVYTFPPPPADAVVGYSLAVRR